ncbi:MAG: cytidylate kinase-like family protein [Oscillibacter sp.]|nr:cytidylate kinase-like family protein [Oscillibacter sp.]
MNKIITISREFSSGGREFGRRLSENLGFAYYDQEIVQEIAKRTELSEKYVQQVMTHRPISYPIHIGRSFRMMADPNMDQSQNIFREQCNILREMAEKSDCVIVGRCADYILQEMDPFRIFLYADMPSKVKRCREKNYEKEDLSDKELEKRINAINRRRADYYEYYTGQKWGDRIHYDLCINTTQGTIKGIAAAIARLCAAQ